MIDAAAGDAWAAAFAEKHGRPASLRERVEWNTDRMLRAPYRAAVAAIDGRAAVRGAEWVDPFAPDHAIRLHADHRADLIGRELDAWPAATDSDTLARWVCERVAALGGRPFTWAGKADGAPVPAGDLGPMLARARCPLWWRRQLRRAVVRARETLGMHRGEVRARAQVYCTDDTVARRRERTAANRAMLEATEIENAAGQVITLAQAADAGVANKTIRRGELMTRINGCDAWATAAGLVGVFTTNTCPSRFHPQTMHGGANPKHDGQTPRDGQAWLRATWARCRAKLARLGVRVFGFRVAEPHHDGCPHWHMMLWCRPGDVARLGEVMRAAWLADEGDEPGADLHRVRIKPLEAGAAAAYCAKYIAKNIDDAGAVASEGHEDTDHEGNTAAATDGKAGRVEAWAAAWGIRQFQAVGQPPVTVWRELRRIGDEMVQGAHPDIRAAHAAVSRDGARRADWCAYMAAQGGPMVGRGYRVRIALDDTAQRMGRYGEEQAPRPMGVEHVARPGEWCLSDRQEWRAPGAWAAATAAAPIQPGAYVINGDGAFVVNGWHAEWQAGRAWKDAAGVLHEPQRAAPAGPVFGQGLAPCPPRSRFNNCTGRPAKPKPAGMTEDQRAAFWARLGESPPPIRPLVTGTT